MENKTLIGLMLVAMLFLVSCTVEYGRYEATCEPSLESDHNLTFERDQNGDIVIITNENLTGEIKFTYTESCQSNWKKEGERTCYLPGLC